MLFGRGEADPAAITVELFELESRDTLRVGAKPSGRDLRKGLGGVILNTDLSFLCGTWADCDVPRAVCGSLGGISIDALTKNVRGVSLWPRLVSSGQLRRRSFRFVACYDWAELTKDD